MKKLLYLLGVTLFFSAMGYGQPVKPQDGIGEIKDLKELSTKYCKVYLTPKMKKWVAAVESDTQFLFIVNKETGEPIFFHGTVELLNFLWSEGWKIVSYIPADNPYMLTGGYLLEKIEK